MRRRRGFALLIALPLAAAPGCGSAYPELEPVEGTVTIDGKPTARLAVEFIPLDGAPSYGVTDEEGHYVQQFTDDDEGVFPGKCKVRIYPWEEFFVPELMTEPPEKTVEWPRSMDSRYNIDTELTADVQPGGGPYDFDLVSQ